MPILSTEYQFQSFREQLCGQFEYRADSAMDLLDALSSNNHAPSVVELSLNPLFRRDYTSLFKAIGESLALSLPEEDEPKSKENSSNLIELIAQTVPIPKQRPFYLFGLDCTPFPRLFSPTLEDRGMVYLKCSPLSRQKKIKVKIDNCTDQRQTQ